MSGRQLSPNETFAKEGLSILTADRLTSLELIEVQLLCDNLQESKYRPTSHPVIMVVGAAAARGPLLLSNFHHLLFNIPREDQRIIGCDPKKTAPVDSDQFDHFQGDPTLGNAAATITWLAALTHIGATDPYAVDLTYIKYPDLVDPSAWANCFTRSTEFTRENGAVVSFVRSTDSAELDELLLILKETSNIIPILHRSDLPSLDSSSTGSHSHLIVFKGGKVVREKKASSDSSRCHE